MRRRVDAGIGDCVQGGGENDGDSQAQRGGLGDPAGETSRARNQSPNVHRGFGGEQRQKRRYRQQVAHELHVERAHDYEIGDYPSQ